MATARRIERVEAEIRARNRTTLERDILLHLRGGQGANDEEIARAISTGVSLKTVRHAIRRARDLGLITWTERRVRAGWRLVRATNVYSFLTPRGPVSPTTSTKVQPERGSRKRRFSGLFVAAREDRGPSSGSDDWARANAQRQIRILLAGAGKEDGS